MSLQLSPNKPRPDSAWLQFIKCDAMRKDVLQATKSMQRLNSQSHKSCWPSSPFNESCSVQLLELLLGKCLRVTLLTSFGLKSWSPTTGSTMGPLIKNTNIVFHAFIERVGKKASGIFLKNCYPMHYQRHQLTPLTWLQWYDDLTYVLCLNALSRFCKFRNTYSVQQLARIFWQWVRFVALIFFTLNAMWWI
jgi:hypothetical protein